MAAGGGAWSMKDEILWWGRVGEAGIEVSLRNIGCTEEAIAKTVSFLRASEFDSTKYVREILPILRVGKTKDAPAAFLATLGRGVSSHVKSITVNPSCVTNGREAIALIANLVSNTNLEGLSINYLRNDYFRQHIPLLATAFRVNSAVRRLSFDDTLETDDVRSLLAGFSANQALKLTHLEISWRQLSDQGFKSIADFLTTNVTLKKLDLNGVWCKFDGVIHIAAALEQNSTLEELCFRSNSQGGNGMKRLLEPLSGKPGHAGSSSSSSKNTTLRILNLGPTDKHNFSVESVALMIKTNKCLRELNLSHSNLPPEYWTEHIFPSLKENETLETLDLSGCRGLTEAAYQGLVDALKFSTTGLTKIVLSNTEIESKQGSVDEELRINQEYRSRLRSQPQVQTTSGRLVLCGYQFAGKTAIRKTIERIAHGGSRENQLLVGWKKAIRASPRLRRMIFGRNAHLELTTRTRGLDILVLRNQAYLAAVWDFAGQREYYALHDYLFPNVMNSCFLYVCSPWYPPDVQNPHRKLKSLLSMRAECEYWMRFIASNCKSVHHGQQLPQVRFVLSHKDTLDSTTLNSSRQHAEGVVQELKHKFQDVIALCETVEVIDANSTEDIKRLISLTNGTLEEVLEHQTEYAVCKGVRSALESWSTQNPSRLSMTLAEFDDLCQNQVGGSTLIPSKEANSLSIEDCRTILAYLNDIGEIIYPKGLDFIVLNPRWFGVGVLGSLIDALGVVDFDKSSASMCTNGKARSKPFWKLQHSEGFVERRSIQGLLEQSLQMANLKQNISSDQLIKLLVRLELGFETRPGHADSSLFIPTLFDDEHESAAKGKRQLQWKLVRPERARTLHYLARRLECEKRSTTCLTPGFFPRFQVYLYNYIHQQNWTGNPSFEVGRNLLCFAENGIEVVVEYSGDIDYFVDILVRSSKPYAEALKFIEEHVVKKLVQFCASPQGCQGVLLVEAVIRPECVRRLHRCVDRKAHSVPISLLKAGVAQDKGYEHIWSHQIADVKGTDFALDLLEGEGSHKRVGNHQGETRFSSMASRIASRWASGSNQGQHYLYMVQQQLPRLFYPSIEDVGWLRKLDQMLNVAKVMPIKLHLMCDHKDGSHKVEGQAGRTMKLSLKEDSFDLPLAKLAVTLLWTGASAGTTIAGAGGSLPVVDRWIQSMFDVPYMPAISGETLQQLVKQRESSGEKDLPISEQDILKALERYMQIDPYTEGIKKILNLQDGDKFWKDFRLRKVIYTDGDHANKVWWVCKHHYEAGLRERILQSVPYSLHH